MRSIGGDPLSSRAARRVDEHRAAVDEVRRPPAAGHPQRPTPQVRPRPALVRAVPRTTSKAWPRSITGRRSTFRDRSVNEILEEHDAELAASSPPWPSPGHFALGHPAGRHRRLPARDPCSTGRSGSSPGPGFALPSFLVASRCSSTSSRQARDSSRPTAGREGWRYKILPSFALGLLPLALCIAPRAGRHARGAPGGLRRPLRVAAVCGGVASSARTSCRNSLHPRPDCGRAPARLSRHGRLRDRACSSPFRASRATSSPPCSPRDYTVVLGHHGLPRAPDHRRQPRRGHRPGATCDPRDPDDAA